MVRSNDDELKLKICRNNFGRIRSDIPINERRDILAHQRGSHHSVDETMSFALKQKPINPPWNYKIISINKDQNTNEHSIRIGIKNEPQPKGEEVAEDTSSVAGRLPFVLNPTMATTPQQKFKLKMMPNPVNSVQVTQSVGATSHAADESQLASLDSEETIGAEPLQTVSTARAMFENMSTSSKRLKDITKAKSNMKSWNSSSLLDSCDIEKTRSAPAVKPVKGVHGYSKSLPVDLSKKQYEKVVITCERPTVSTTSSGGNNKQNKEHVERPKSAFSYDDKKSNLKTDTGSVNSCCSDNNALYSEINRNYLSLEQQMANSSSLSSEDLRHNGRTSHPCSKNDCANELRQAANKYHQDVMKNFPKFRNTITGKDNSHKFSTRKGSIPVDEPFARGEVTRATVATSSNVRLPRSYSTSDSLEIQDLQDVLLKSSDNSMMSRLLRDQSNQNNTMSLVKGDEEKSYKLVLRSNHLDNFEKTYEGRDQCISEENQKNRHTSINESPRSSNAKNRSDFPVEREEINVKPATQLESSLSLEEMIDEISVLPIAQVPVEQVPPTNNVNSDSQSYNTNTDENKAPLYTHVETDIDSEEASEIIHRKEASTDSAVCVLDAHEISHMKALSNESTDSMPDFSDYTYKQHDLNDYLTSHADEDLHYDGDYTSEREKPQRTINRRKKDSSRVSSRNNSYVSTDSTTSTATNDSGIVVGTDSSPRTSPLSNDSYYTKDLLGSRETLDDDVNALSDDSHLMSTPDRNSPRSEDLDNEKTKLVGSMREKINELRDQEQEIADEIKMNEELGKKVMNMVKIKATQVEFNKFELFIGELNKIVALLLSLTQRLHRYELTLQDLDMTDEGDQAKKGDLISKIDKLKNQHEEACDLRDVNDKRGDAVASFLVKYCSEEEFADFQYYVDMKSQLALMQSEIREKVKLGEERLKALELTSSDWGFK